MQINAIKQLKSETSKLEAKLYKLKKNIIKSINLKNNNQNIKNETKLNNSFTNINILFYYRN